MQSHVEQHVLRPPQHIAISTNSKSCAKVPSAYRTSGNFNSKLSFDMERVARIAAHLLPQESHEQVLHLQASLIMCCCCLTR